MTETLTDAQALALHAAIQDITLDKWARKDWSQAVRQALEELVPPAAPAPLDPSPEAVEAVRKSIASETRLEQFLSPKMYPERVLPLGVRLWPDENGLQPRDMSWGYVVTARNGREHLQHGDVILYEGVMPRRVLRYQEVRAMLELGAVQAERPRVLDLEIAHRTFWDRVDAFFDRWDIDERRVLNEALDAALGALQGAPNEETKP